MFSGVGFTNTQSVSYGKVAPMWEWLLRCRLQDLNCGCETTIIGVPSGQVTFIVFGLGRNCVQTIQIPGSR